MDTRISNSYFIAVTGHRFIPNSAELEKTIRIVLETQIKIHSGKIINLYSALAEGSDQLVAKIAAEYSSISLWVPLPMNTDEYIKDFSTQISQTSFTELLSSAAKTINLSANSDHQRPYERLGHFLVNQSDVLIALWDGFDNQKKGGTSDVVRLALNAGKPVYWIYCPNLNISGQYNLNQQKHIGHLELLNPPG